MAYNLPQVTSNIKGKDSQKQLAKSGYFRRFYE